MIPWLRRLNLMPVKDQCACGDAKDRHEIEPPYPCYDCSCLAYFYRPVEEPKPAVGRIEFKCPQCGWVYGPPQNIVGNVPKHSDGGKLCAGVGQKPRGLADRRPLWSEEQPTNTAAPVAERGAILPCPLCYSADVYIKIHQRVHTVRCRACGLYLDRPVTSVGEAEKVWNTRTSNADNERLVEVVRELSEALEFYADETRWDEPILCREVLHGHSGHHCSQNRTELNYTKGHGYEKAKAALEKAVALTKQEE